MPQPSFLRPASCLLACGLLLGTSSAAAPASVSLADVLAASTEVAVFMETYRALPTEVHVGTLTLDPAAFLQVAAQATIAIADGRPAGTFTGNWSAPVDPYPHVALTRQVYGPALARDEYVPYLRSLLQTTADSTRLASTISLRGGEVRLVDLLYAVAQILRYQGIFGHLPGHVMLTVASPNGLFPWAVPAQLQEYVGAVRNNEAAVEINEHLQSSSMDFSMYEVAKQIVAQETDAYRAGERIYDWVHSLWFRNPYGATLSFPPTFGSASNSYEEMRYMMGTSGTPHRPKEGLYPAAGLPYGFGGALYVAGHGWFNAELHAAYGSALSANPFYYYDPVHPTPGNAYRIPLLPGDGLLAEVATLAASTGRAPDLRAAWINGEDIRKYGAQTIADLVREGGFSTLIITLKTFLGSYYSDPDIPSQGPGLPAEVEDTILAAKQNGLQVFAAMNTLADRRFLDEGGFDRAQKFQTPLYGTYPRSEFYLSPCVPAVVAHLHEAIARILALNGLDGVVLLESSVHSDGWANAECPPGAVASTQSKRTYLAAFVNELATYAKQVDSRAKVLHLTAPLMDEEGRGIFLQTIDDPDLSALDPAVVDGVILDVPGLAWLTSAREARQVIVQQALDATTIPVHQTVYLSKEWQFPSEFYRGLGSRLAAEGLAGVVLVSNVSGAGELGSAFVDEHWAKIKDGPFADRVPCRPNDTTLCVSDHPGDNRFKVEVAYRTSSGGGLAGYGHAIPLEALGVGRGGLFWFFGQNNPEMLVKILDGGSYFWFFSSAGTNVGLTTTVTDTTSGSKVIYSNPDGKAALPVQHTSVFSPDGSVGPPYVPVETSFDYGRDFTQGATGASICLPDAGTLCLRNRFRVAVRYETSQGGGFSGAGVAIPLSSEGVEDGGLFWFFGGTNPEILVKVLDGCAVNGMQWVFFSAGTNVGYVLTVEDTLLGIRNEYRNPDMHPAPPVQHTSALPCTFP
ncbi:MAG: hypothetical protein IPJ17_06615 [Holophagales bacterium]|nr:MAG: hypothetical protein IPJ17_06615 [Holophagales bacterium]